jgi:hypothetical protein
MSSPNAIEILTQEAADLKCRLAEKEKEVSNLKIQLDAAKKSPSSSKPGPKSSWAEIMKKLGDCSNSTVQPSSAAQQHTSPDQHPDESVLTGHNNKNKVMSEFAIHVMQEFQELKDMMKRIRGVPKPIEEVKHDSYADSPFSKDIAMVELPKKFIVPSMITYDGSSDPRDHVAHYKQKMFTIPIPMEIREVCLCKGFGSTLSGAALQWFVNLPNGAIDSFASLVNQLNCQFASSRKLEKQPFDLYKIVQGCDESLRDYLHRFNKEKISILGCENSTAIEAFRQGLLFDSDLYKELTKHKCLTFEDVQAKALAHIRLEEDEWSRPNKQLRLDKDAEYSDF